MSSTLRVGDLLAPGITSYPEMSHYAWDPIGHAGAAHHRLVIFARRPSPQELVAFRSSGRFELGFLVDGPVILVVWRGAGWPWGDAPYSWHMQEALHRAAGREFAMPSVDPVPEGSGVPLDVWLVDAATGVVSAMRRVAMPGAFACDLHSAIAAQARGPWEQRAYDAHLAGLVSIEADRLARSARRVVFPVG